MRRSPGAAGSVEHRELGRSYSPIAALLPRYDMKVKVRCLLTAEDAVVLEREYPEGVICLDQCFGNPPGRNQYSCALLAGKIEQRGDISAGDDAALSNFELLRIDYRQRVIAFIDDLPFLLAAGWPSGIDRGPDPAGQLPPHALTFYVQ